MSLYSSILGDQWNTIHPKLKRLHSGSPATHAHCVLCVTNGSSPLARILCRALRLPNANPSAAVTLTVRALSRLPEEEIWERRFPDYPLTSTQSVSPEGHLVESFGRVVFWFRLAVREGGIDLDLMRTFIRCGTKLLRLPSGIAPVILAREEPSSEENSVRILVEVNVPVVGRLLSYKGTAHVRE